LDANEYVIVVGTVPAVPRAGSFSSVALTLVGAAGGRDQQGVRILPAAGAGHLPALEWCSGGSSEVNGRFKRHHRPNKSEMTQMKYYNAHTAHMPPIRTPHNALYSTSTQHTTHLAATSGSKVAKVTPGRRTMFRYRALDT